MKILFTILFIILFSNIFNSSYAAPVTIKKTVWHHMGVKDHFEIVTDNVRAGKTAQKFEIRHGECKKQDCKWGAHRSCLLYTSPSPRDQRGSRMPSSA